MKPIYFTLAAAIITAVLLGGAAVQFAAVGAAFGWIAYENRKAKEARR